MALLVAKELHKHYESQAFSLEVLQGISLELNPGEAWAILGASGAGKSTLLHCLGTLDPPDQGSVWFKGEEVYQWPEKKLAGFRNRTIGFVFQFHHLLPMLTALENTQLPCMIAGESTAVARKKAEVILDQVGLGKRLTHRPGELSGGEQQRVALARALVMNPALILADEPTGNLDSQTGREMADLLLELRERYNTTLMLVTHNEELAVRLNYQVFLKDGKIVSAE